MKKICCCLLTCLLALSAFTQNNGIYKTARLKDMANLLSITETGTRLEGYHSLPAWTGYPVVMHINQNRIIDHIGIHLFNREQIRDKDMSVVLDFVERYLLELILIKDKSRIAGKLREDKVTLEYGDFPALKKITESLLLEITQSDSRKYRISWTDKTDNRIIYALSFPMYYELMLGMNKIEIENNLAEEIKAQVYNIKVTEPVRKENLIPVPQTKYYIKQGEKYILETLNSNLYYIKSQDGTFSLLFDEKFPVESLSNLMISDDVENNYSLNITQNKYGQNVANFTVPLKQWIRYCLNVGCTAYFGLESQDENQIKASVVMENKKLAYNHVLYIIFDKTQLSKANGIINAKLHAYIPTHNVTDLFYETQNKSKTKQKN